MTHSLISLNIKETVNNLCNHLSLDKRRERERGKGRLWDFGIWNNQKVKPLLLLFCGSCWCWVLHKSKGKMVEWSTRKSWGWFVWGEGDAKNENGEEGRGDSAEKREFL